MPKQSGLTEEVNTSGQHDNLPPVPYHAPPKQWGELEPVSTAVPLSHYLWILRRQAWMILAFVAVCVLATAIVSSRLQPIYEATATIVIDREAPSEVVGANSSSPNAAFDDADQFLATQSKLIQSDAVLRPVAEQFHLLSQEGQLKKMSPDKAQEMIQAPVGLGGLKVTRPPNTYLLLISYRSPDSRLAANVANAVANSYLAHTYDIRIRSSASLSSFMEKQLDELKAKMEKSGLALAQFEKDLDVINPEEKTNILSARLLQLNTDYTTAQAERVNKEAAWNAMKSGSLEAAQVSSQGEALARLSESLNQARQKFALVKSTYGPTHPEYRKAASELAEVEKQFESARSNAAERIAVEYKEALNREQMLQKAVAETKAEWDNLNSRSYQYQQLKREADSDKTLYDELVRKIKEGDINAGFQNNSIRIADVARPTINKVFPNVKADILMALFFSILLAIGAALLLDTLDTTLRDPQEASRYLGIDVIGMIPLDRLAAQLPKSMEPVPADALVAKFPKSGKQKGTYHIASEFDEAIRTLRNTILLSDFEGRLNSILIASSNPAEGKSTLAAHLAVSNADRGKKILLVDGDLRRPSLHTKFGLTLREGLSNVLTGEMRWQDVIVHSRKSQTSLSCPPEQALTVQPI